MASVTVEQLASVVGISAERLLKQMQEAGLKQQAATDSVSDEEKQVLLAFLKQSHSKSASTSATSERITLKRKTHSTLKVASTQGKNATVNVEVRKRRTYVKKVSGDQQTADTASETTIEQITTPETIEQPSSQPGTESSTVTPAATTSDGSIAEPATASEANAKTPTKEVTSAEKSKAQEKPGLKKEKDLLDEGEHRKKKAGRSKKKVLDDDIDNINVIRAVLAIEEEPESKKAKQKTPITVFKPMAGITHGFTKPTKPIIHEVEIHDNITVNELAQKMSVKANEVIKVLMKLGIMATINQPLDIETAVLVIEEMGHSPKIISIDTEAETLAELTKIEGDLEPRAAVVTIMGHVDHGKTSLLDYIRRTKVASGEAGGITQHIGAYHVDTGHGEITFLDTPGHAAFTAMRARGAKCTDIVILVVAADEGVKPQTEEAIQHARAAEAPIIVAINKIDKPEADLDRIKNELAQYNIIPEDWGGDTQFVPVSAKTGAGIDQLLEAILIQAEILELKAVRNTHASGVVIESSINKHRGPVTTLLIQNGTLKQGDTVLVGEYFGRVRAMQNEKAETLKSAGPSIPVEILGINGSPNAGDEFVVVKDEKQARELAEMRATKLRQQKLAHEKKINLENLFAQADAGKASTLNIALKADVRGSLEAIQAALQELSDKSEKTDIKIISSGIGGITETDANLALASNAILIGFNVRADSAAKRIIEKEELELRYYSVIYHLIEDIQKALLGLVKPEYREQILGVAEVRDVFRSPKFGQVAGCMVIEGTVYRNKPIRVLRDNVVIFEGELESLRRFKDDVGEVRNGMECGIGVKNYNDVKAGDKIEVYSLVEIKPEF